MTEFEKAFTLSGGGNTEPIAFRARMEALSGNPAAAREAIRLLTELSARKYVPPYNLAMIYCGLGDEKNALACLEQGFAEKDVRLVFLKVEPRWDCLRDNPQFIDLLRRLNFAPQL